MSKFVIKDGMAAGAWASMQCNLHRPILIVQQHDETLYQKRLQSRETGKSFSNR